MASGSCSTTTIGRTRSTTKALAGCFPVLSNPAWEGDLGPGRAVLADVDAERSVASPSHVAGELSQGLHDQRDHLLMSHGIVDLDPGAARREVHHPAFEV